MAPNDEGYVALGSMEHVYSHCSAKHYFRTEYLFRKNPESLNGAIVGRPRFLLEGSSLHDLKTAHWIEYDQKRASSNYPRLQQCTIYSIS